jgi:hypothetical protein
MEKAFSDLYFLIARKKIDEISKNKYKEAKTVSIGLAEESKQKFYQIIFELK